MGMYFVKNWYCKPLKDDAIYGAEWAGTSDPSWVRTDAAVGFSAPNPYYAGMSTTPSSPFDNIMPWSGMRRVTDASAGELVEIPKFYYKWTRNGAKMKLQISMSAFDGSHVSPAHADRGDGVGERDYVYVGRYQCVVNTYKSTSGANSLGATRANHRSYIHSLGNNVWQWDYAMFWTIGMLYLVEYANWDSICIGASGFESAIQGYTDNMPYHTGTTKNTRTEYGMGIQYRNIEGLYGACDTWIDGIFFSGSNIYVYKNPVNFVDSTSGTGSQLVGQRCTTSDINYIKTFDGSSVSGYEWFMYPKTVQSAKGYTNSIYQFHPYGSTQLLSTIGEYNNSGNTTKLKLFSHLSYSNLSDNWQRARLMVLPPSRLSA